VEGTGRLARIGCPISAGFEIWRVDQNPQSSKERHMANEHVQEFTDANFEAEVLKSDQPVLVDFWAEWCMPCRMLAPTVDQIAEEFAGKAKVGKLDTDANREVAVKYGIHAIPTIILFKDGEPVEKFIGLKNRDELAAAINGAVGAA
jgi:thioredoxin 1